MNKNPSETKRLADTAANLATTISEIIDARLKTALESKSDFQSSTQPNAALEKAFEGWIKKKDVAKHLNISSRSLDNWMAKGVIPFVRLGRRRVYFKLSEVDEAINRRFKVNALW